MTLSYTTNGYLRINAAEIDEEFRRSNILVQAINRGIDITDRLSKQYKMNDPVATEVLDYIKDYEDICSMFSENVIEISAAEESAWEIVKRVISELWRMLLKLWDGVKHCFRWMFNSQYRAASTAVKYRQMFMLADSTSGVADKFANLEVFDTVNPEDLDKYISHTHQIVLMLRDANEFRDSEGVDMYITRESERCGIKFNGTQFLDADSENIEVISGTYGTCGWSLKKANSVCVAYVNLCGAAVKLKNIERELESDINELKRQINNKVSDGADDVTLSETQKKLVFKTKVLNFTQAGLVILTKRVATIDTVIGRAARDAATLQKGQIPNEDD